MPRGGVKGNKGGKGGSRKAPEMAEFYARLDAACLDTVDYLAAVVKEAKKRLYDDEYAIVAGKGMPTNVRDWRKDGINAAGKLIQKAPERLANGDGTNLETPVIYLPKQDE